MRNRVIASILGAYFGVQGSAFAVSCDMQHAFNQPDNNGKSEVAIWEDAGRALLFGGGLHVNTDGTRRSYSVTDFWGDKSAINNLCNAMSDKCADLKTEEELRGRRILTEKAREAGWPPELLAETRISSKIIPFKNGKPCPEVDGFLVSATALHKQAIRDVCEISNYVDAISVPAIVLPGRIKGNPTGFESRGAQVGDLAAVMSADGNKIVYAVVGDIGPARELGEGTVALAGALLGKTSEPANYREVRGKTPYLGKGWDVKKTFTVVFPGTRKETAPYLTKARIDADAAAALANWGGEQLFKACSLEYDKN